MTDSKLPGLDVDPSAPQSTLVCGYVALQNEFMADWFRTRAAGTMAPAARETFLKLAIESTKVAAEWRARAIEAARDGR